MKDPILELMVKFTENEEPLETGITLVVDGFLVSGYMISKDKYMEHNVLTSSMERAIKQAISDHDLEEPEHNDTDERDYIHLRDAKYYSPGQNPIPANDTIFCRIPLVKVSGFTIGVLGVD